MNFRAFLLFCMILWFADAKSQDYSVIYTHPNSVGQPSQLFLSQVKVQNSSSEGIFMHFERIVNNLPGTWTSCFCYPFCVAPWIDTATFYVNGSSTDSIMPNFGTDSIPAMATVTIVLYQMGYENMADTITFTGSTLPAGITPTEQERISVYPNPFVDQITIGTPANGSTLTIRNCSGALIGSYQLSGEQNSFDLSFLSRGFYWAEITSELGERRVIQIVKSE